MLKVIRTIDDAQSQALGDNTFVYMNTLTFDQYNLLSEHDQQYVTSQGNKRFKQQESEHGNSSTSST
jgi:hypothetical protein